LTWRIGRLAGVKLTLPDSYNISAVDPKRTSEISRAALGHRSLKYGGKRPDIICGCSADRPSAQLLPS
jgi:hypothetical protein